MLWIQINYESTFLYEVFEGFIEAADGEKIQIHKSLCEQIWRVPNKREIKKCFISFAVNDGLLGNKNISETFLKYNKIPYMSYRGTTNNQNSWYLLRQKINNLYSVMCDENICLNKEYFNCLKTARKIYFECINNEHVGNPAEIEKTIQKALDDSTEIKSLCALQKMKLTWSQYKKIINSFLWKCLCNYKPLSENEDSSKIILCVDYWIEDNYVLSYLGKCLSGYLKNYEKEVYSKTSRKNSRDKRQYKRCSRCGKLFLSASSRKKLCAACVEYQPIKEKTVKCVDCGKDFLINSKDNNTHRCDECYKKYRKKYYRENKQKQREIKVDVHSTILR